MVDELIVFISEYFDISKDNIKPESTFVADLGLQSYNLIEMCCSIEEKYDIEVSEDDIINIFTVSDLAGYIEGKRVQN